MLTRFEALLLLLNHRVRGHGDNGQSSQAGGLSQKPGRCDASGAFAQMPQMDGFTATRLLRARPQLQGLPIIAMTAHAMVEEQQQCFEAGMNGHVSKPIDPDALFTTLMRWVKPRKGQAVETEARTAIALEDTALPEMEGVDVAAGLRRVAGNKRLYLDLLARFAAQQANAGAQIAAAIESGD